MITIVICMSGALYHSVFGGVNYPFTEYPMFAQDMSVDTFEVYEILIEQNGLVKPLPRFIYSPLLPVWVNNILAKYDRRKISFINLVGPLSQSIKDTYHGSPKLLVQRRLYKVNNDRYFQVLKEEIVFVY